MLYGLGNGCVSKGKFEKCLEHHMRCLKQYRATLGNRHRIENICRGLVDGNLRIQNYAEAQYVLWGCSSDRLWGCSVVEKNEDMSLPGLPIRRRKFSHNWNEIKAGSEFQNAFQLRQCLVPNAIEIWVNSRKRTLTILLLSGRDDRSISIMRTFKNAMEKGGLLFAKHTFHRTCWKAGDLVSAEITDGLSKKSSKLTVLSHKCSKSTSCWR